MRIPATRMARPDEAAALTALCLRSKASNGYDAAFMAACAAELTVTPGEIAEGLFWVAGDAPPLGCAQLILDARGGAGEVARVFVDPECQGRGIGRALWGRVLAEARAQGLRRLHLDADPFAEEFYRRLGFRETGRSPSGSIPGRTLARMRLDLDGGAVSAVPPPPPARPSRR